MHRSIYIAASLGAATFFAPAALKAAPPATVSAEAIDPQRLALGEQVAKAIWPDGTYQTMMKQMMGGEEGIIDAILDMKPTDIVDEETLKKDSKDGELPADARQTMREAMKAKDPYFEERMKLTMKTMGEEMGRIFAPLEPKMRGGLAKAYARRFSAEQLTDIANFFATPSGKAFAGQSMMIATDKEFIRETMAAMPEFTKQMPQVMEKVKQATAHLPPPPKAEGEEGDDEDESEIGSAADSIG